MSVVMLSKHYAIDVVSQVAFHIKPSCAIARHGSGEHQHCISSKQCNHPDDLSANTEIEINETHSRVADRDTLQHAKQSRSGKIESRDKVQEYAEQVQDEGPAKDGRDKGASACSCTQTPPK